jgi:hypothetical protein
MRLDLPLRRDDPVLALVRLHIAEDLLLPFGEHYWTNVQYSTLGKLNSFPPRARSVDVIC